ncbi:MAG: hypothetical protein ACRDJW_03905 [Thermomicrobiales bacterium]
MPNWRFWDKENDGQTAEPEMRRRTATIGGPVPRPPREVAPAKSSLPHDERLARLRKRREAIIFDVEQAEAALRPENPWQERIALLEEAIGTVDADVKALAELPKVESTSLSATPIEEIAVSIAEPPSVSFWIGGETFCYEEEIDWAERGTTVVHGELKQRSGEVERLVPPATPDQVRDALTTHLTDSLFVFATDLRERKLAAEPLPVAPTLAELAQPCPECGGWRDWKGQCPECTRRAFRRQQLGAEVDRLVREQDQERDDLAKWAERVPIARRRLADVDAEIAALGG